MPHSLRPLLLAALVACTAVGNAQAQTGTVPSVVVGSAVTGGGFELDGALQAIQQSTVAAQVPGNVLALSVKAGDRVRRGQSLARIDERDVQAAFARTDAGVAQADAELRNARVNAERTRDLRAQGFVSQAALDTADTQLKAAQAGLRQAEAARSQAALARGFATVVAPFEGVVLATHLDAGDLAAPGRAIATVYAPGALRATLQVPLSQAGAWRKAQRVEIELPGGQRVQPLRRTELQGADPVSQTVEWRFDLEPAAVAALLPGQVVRAWASGAPVADASPRLRLPASAVLRRGELTAVYVAQDRGFVLRAVRLGADRGSEGVEVLAGLKPGEKVAAQALAAGMSGAVPAK